MRRGPTAKGSGSGWARPSFFEADCLLRLDLRCSGRRRLEPRRGDAERWQEKDADIRPLPVRVRDRMRSPCFAGGPSGRPPIGRLPTPHSILGLALLLRFVTLPGLIDQVGMNRVHVGLAENVIGLGPGLGTAISF